MYIPEITFPRQLKTSKVDFMHELTLCKVQGQITRELPAEQGYHLVVTIQVAV